MYISFALKNSSKRGKERVAEKWIKMFQSWQERNINPYIHIKMLKLAKKYISISTLDI